MENWKIVIAIYPLGCMALILVVLVIISGSLLIGNYHGWRACEKHNKKQFEFEDSELQNH